MSGNADVAAATVARPSLGRRIAKGLGAFFLLLLFVAGVAFAIVYQKSQARFDARFRIDVAPLVVPPTTDAEAVARGRHVAQIRGCLDCHGAQGQGQVFLEQMPVMRLIPANISPGGPTARYTSEDWVRAVRHGVRPDGSAILFMPVEDNANIDDRDLGDLVAYLKTLPASTNDLPHTQIGPMGRILYLAGKLPLVAAERIEHRPSVPAAPPVGPTPEYGAYLATTCTGCHGFHYSGGPIPGVPPEWPPAANLTAHETGLRGVTVSQFEDALRRGKHHDGHHMNPQFMPWNQFKNFTDVEIGAIFAFLHTVPPRPAGQR